MTHFDAHRAIERDDIGGDAIGRLRKRSLSWLSNIGMAITLLAAAGSISLAMGLAGMGALAARVFSGWMA